MARKKDATALDADLESADETAEPAPARVSRRRKPSAPGEESAGEGAEAAMASVEAKRSKRSKPLAELEANLNALLEQSRAAGVNVDDLDAPLEAALELARKAEAKAQVIDHLDHALTVENATQVGDHIEEALHVLKAD